MVLFIFEFVRVFYKRASTLVPPCFSILLHTLLFEPFAGCMRNSSTVRSTSCKVLQDWSIRDARPISWSNRTRWPSVSLVLGTCPRSKVAEFDQTR